MCAAVLGSKRSYCFDDVPQSPVSKRHRCGGGGSVSGSSPSRLSGLSRLQSIFPQLEPQVLEKVLEECGYDADSAIANLHECSVDSAENNCNVAEGYGVNVQQGAASGRVDTSNGSMLAPDHLPKSGQEWVDLFVRELTGATNIDDFKARTTILLENFEKLIKSSGKDAGHNLNEENAVLKQKFESAVQENGILKRAVSIQHERQQDYELKTQELQHLKQLVAQYQEQLRTLEVNNYALTMHLKQAQQGNSIPGRFHPDVF